MSDLIVNLLRERGDKKTGYRNVYVPPPLFSTGEDLVALVLFIMCSITLFFKLAVMGV